MQLKNCKLFLFIVNGNISHKPHQSSQDEVRKLATFYDLEYYMRGQNGMEPDFGRLHTQKSLI